MSRRSRVLAALAATVALGAAPAGSATATIPSRATAETIAISGFFTAAQRAVGATDAVHIRVSRGNTGIRAWLAGRNNEGGPITSVARFRVASLSKLVTAATVMRLVEAGKVRLDVPLVQQWTPARTPADARFNRITVRQLLMHTSGIPVMWSTFFASSITDWRVTADIAVRTPMAANPGAAYLYSNANYTLLGRLIERVTGMTYVNAARTYVLYPLGITEATLLTTAANHTGDPLYRATPGRRYMEALGPAGAWVMRPPSVTRLAVLQTKAGPPLLTPASIAAMRVKGPPTGWPFRYGLGLMLFDGGGWGHTGTIEAARALVETLPNGYVVEVLVSSLSTPTTSTLMEQLGPSIAAIARLP